MAASMRVELGEIRRKLGARQADRGVRLVDRAVGLDPEIVLRPPLAGAERRRAVVAGLRVDLVQDDHAGELTGPRGGVTRGAARRLRSDSRHRRRHG